MLILKVLLPITLVFFSFSHSLAADKYIGQKFLRGETNNGQPCSSFMELIDRNGETIVKKLDYTNDKNAWPEYCRKNTKHGEEGYCWDPMPPVDIAFTESYINGQPEPLLIEVGKDQIRVYSNGEGLYSKFDFTFYGVDSLLSIEDATRIEMNRPERNIKRVCILK